MSRHSVSSWGQLYPVRQESGSVFTPRTERRGWIRYLCDVVTSCQRVNAPDDSSVLAKIRNISQGGVNLIVSQPFEAGAILSVELPAGQGEPACTILGCVVHAQPQSNGEWVLGCSFVRELTDHDLEPYGAGGQRSNGSDPRKWMRYSCNVQATYRLVRVTERKRSPIKVVDISPCGVGLLVDRCHAIGTVLSLELPGVDGQTTFHTFACVVRVKKIRDDCWSLGCNFIREISDKELRSLVPDAVESRADA